MTSLIDVIFLLLLFFMLTSTFSKFSEIELTAAASGAPASPDLPPIFLQLKPDSVGLNGTPVALAALSETVNATASGTKDAPQTVLVSMSPDVSAQRLTDVLAALRSATGVSVTVLGTRG